MGEDRTMGYRLLIAQGDAYLSEFMVEQFAEMRFEVAVAATGPETLQYFHAFLPEVVIVDADTVNDPLLMKRMRQTPQGDHSIILIITSDENSMTYDEFSLADQVLLKPVTISQLESAIRQFISTIFKTKPIGNEIRAELRKRLSTSA